MKKYLHPEMEINLFNENEGLLYTASWYPEFECNQSLCESMHVGYNSQTMTIDISPFSIPNDPMSPIHNQNIGNVLGDDWQ